MAFFKSFVFLVIFSIPVAYADHYASFAIKGGISLGSYEAGLNWVFIEEVRRREYVLNTFTGASAGGINAIISAVRACQIKDAPDIKNNIFRKAWNINIDDIMSFEDQPEFDYTDIIENFDEYINRRHTANGSDKGGLFSRKGLLNSVRLVYEEVKNKEYINDCEVNIGIAVTKLFPEIMNVLGVSLKNQRFIFPLKLSVKNKKVIFENLNADDPKFVSQDNYLYLPEKEDGTVDVYDVLKLALASSAFPVAFAPVNLKYCKPVKDASTEGKTNCPANYKKRHDLFLDGGSFDNAPIGSTLTLTEYSLRHGGSNDEKNNNTENDPDHETIVSYGYIDPGNMRKPGRNIHSDRDVIFTGKADEYIAGMTDYISLASNIMDYGMTAELSKALQRYNKPNPNDVYNKPDSSDACNKPGSDSPDFDPNDTCNKPSSKNVFYITSRFYPLVGDYLYHFGAFFDENFRDFDFNVGVYDGVINAARYDCYFNDKKNNEKIDSDYFSYEATKECIGEYAEVIYKNLKVDAGDGNDVFAALAKREFGKNLRSDKWRWLDVDKVLQGKESSKNINIFMALDERDCSISSDCKGYIKPASFDNFLSKLEINNNGYSPFTKKLKVKPGGWIFPVVATSIDRQYEIELMKYEYLKKEHNNLMKENEDLKNSKQQPVMKDQEVLIQKQEALIKNQASLIDDQKNSLKALKAVGLISHTVATRQDKGYWPESTVETSNLMFLVPDEVGGDVRNGGLYFAYNKVIQPVIGSPYVLELSFIPFHDLNDSIYPSANLSLDATLRHHNASPGFSSWGVGAIAYYDWEKEPGVSQDSYGATLDLGILGDKIRISLLYRRIPDLDENQYSLLVGITDFKGFSYWLFD